MVNKPLQLKSPVVKQKKFNTFAGVFMPSLLTILGAVMYFIVPQVLGGVGLIKTILIILLAHTVTIATAFSISAIATNIQVRGGGLYYLISRSLGAEFGGSLGIQLYLAQTIASSFYAIAFARGISIILISFGMVIAESHIALISIALFGLMVFIGAKFVVKIQYFIFAAIALSLVSIFLGPQTVSVSNMVFTSSALSFWVAFAMFFPAVTGIDAGVGMSGELKDPRKSLVKGTFYAIFITLAVYLALVLKLALTASPDVLFTNPQIIQQIALFSPLVLLGIVMATSSSALSSLMTAPRCLVAMTEDKVLPKFLKFLGKKSGENGEPRVAIGLSLMIAAGVILLGSLEYVAIVVAMFFLSVYGWINGSAFFEKISGNPSYRPTFNAPLLISFYGMIAAYGVMFLFNPVLMFVVILIQALLFYLLYRSSKSMKIEGVWSGVLFQLTKKLLGWMGRSVKSRKNWRPTIMAFSTKPLNDHPLSKFLDWIGSKSSMTRLYLLRKGKVDDNLEENIQAQRSMEAYIHKNNLDIFPRTVLTDNFQTTMENLVQAGTVANVPLNTVLIDFDNKLKVNELMQTLTPLNKNLIIMRNQTGFTNFQRIDIWWSSKKNGNLMLLLAHLISNSKQWRSKGAMINVFTIVDDKKKQKSEIQQFERIMKQSRIENLETKVIEAKKKDIKKVINSTSFDADLVMLGLTDLKNRTDSHIRETIKSFTKASNVSLIVSAKDDIDFRLN
jgi:amino acid transporter